MPHLVYVVTDPMSVRLLLKDRVSFMRRRGYEVTVIAGPGEDLNVFSEEEGVRTIALRMQREIAPLRDLWALARLIQIFRELRPDIVNASTTKAGMLGMTAAWLARVPVRVYLLRGLRLSTTRGLKRGVLKLAERWTSTMADRVISVSPSLSRAYVELGVAPRSKLFVAANGSSKGIDCSRFQRRAESRAENARLRERLGIPLDARVIGFAGRFVHDKGVVCLRHAFEQVLHREPHAWLLLVGEFEKGDPVPAECVAWLRQHPRVTFAGWQVDTRPYYSAMDVLAFPSYREGFPNVPLEAAAAEIPTVGYAAVGTVDAVAHDVTGRLVPVGDNAALARELAAYVRDPALCDRHGRAGRVRAVRDYGPEPIAEDLLALYAELLAQHGLSPPRAAKSPDRNPASCDVAI